MSGEYTVSPWERKPLAPIRMHPSSNALTRQTVRVCAIWSVVARFPHAATRKHIVQRAEGVLSDNV